MKFLKKLLGCNYSVCAACKVHFEPVTGYEAQWGQYCAEHRKPIIEDHQRTERIMSWARQNLDRLEPMMQEDAAKSGAALAALQQFGLRQGLGAIGQQAAQGGGYGNTLNNI